MPILFILFVILSTVLAAGFYFYRVAFFPRRHSRADTIRLEIDSGKITSFDNFNIWPHTEISIRSPYGYTLKGYYFPVDGSKKTVIFSHGITITLLGSAKYMPVFRSRGYNMIVYDNRYHGESGGANCSFGYYEKHDLKAVVDWAFDKIGPGGLVGTHGESLGAAVTLQHAAVDPRIAFAIADCPFSDLRALFHARLQADYHLPGFPLLTLSRLYTRMLLGFDYHLVSPISGISSTETPVLLIHGENDSYVPTHMGEDLFATKTHGPRRLYLVPDAGHAYAYSTNPAEYDRQVNAFLDDYHIENQSV